MTLPQRGCKHSPRIRDAAPAQVRPRRRAAPPAIEERSWHLTHARMRPLTAGWNSSRLGPHSCTADLA